jgi:C-terminal processing protease CtpA/Prc
MCPESNAAECPKANAHSHLVPPPQGLTLDQVGDLCVGKEGSRVLIKIRRSGQDSAVDVVRAAAAMRAAAAV